MCSCVHLRSQHNNINFGYKVSPEEGQDTEECGKHLCGHGERISADEVEGEEADPGDHVHHEAEGHALGLVVIGWQVFAHVTESEAENADHGHISKFNTRADREGLAALEHDAILVEFKIHGRPGGVEGHTEHGNDQHDGRHQENCELWPVFFCPLVIGWRQLGCKFKNADNLKGAHSDAGQAHSEAVHEQRLLEDAGQRRWLAKVAQRAYGGCSQGCQHQEAGAAPGRLGYGCVQVEQEDYCSAKDHEKAGGEKEEQGNGERGVPFQQQDSPVQALLTARGRPLLWQTRLANYRI